MANPIKFITITFYQAVVSSNTLMLALCLYEAFKYIGHKAKNSCRFTNTPLCTTN
jgi:hypothetical protein